jgi:aspartate kinase
MKFGGTSVNGIECIRDVAKIVKKEIDAGYQVAVVVSAMSGDTQRLLELCKSTGIEQEKSVFEYALIVSTGEQIVAGLLALALQKIGVPVRSWLGWQIPIYTLDNNIKSRIGNIDAQGIQEIFASGQHAVVAGFQGVSKDNRILTLGRGGSDTSATALAIAMGAERCDIYTDVNGVYTTDPRIVVKARRLNRITYEEMLELASLGAKVLQTRSLELAMKYGVRLRVLSSFENKMGTIICSEEEVVESKEISGIACSLAEAQITILSVLDTPNMAAQIFGCLADADINVDMIVQDVSREGRTNITFTVSVDEFQHACDVLRAEKDAIWYQDIQVDDEVSKVSVVGIGMRSHVGVAQKVFRVMAAEQINIKAITTSEIRISILIKRKYMELAVRALHDAFDLDKEDAN